MYDDAAIAQIEAREKSNTHRLDEHEKRLSELEKHDADVKVLNVRMGNLESDVKEIKSDVKKITERPAKRWEGLVDKLIAALAGAFIAWLIAGGGL